MLDEALACDDPYRATHFHDVYFIDMVLGALAVNVPLRRIVDLRRRLTPESTGRMRRVAAACRAAGHSVPDDLGELAGKGRSAA